MEKFLGIVQDGRFSVLLPRSECCAVKLTRIARPASIADELAASHEIDLAEHEGRAIMVTMGAWNGVVVRVGGGKWLVC